jgi:phosphonatase-like hydrolase
MIKLAVFDMAGTTVADEGFVSKALKNAFFINGYEITEEQVNPLMGYKKIVAIKTLLEQMGEEYDDELLEDIHSDFENEMIAFYESSPSVRAIRNAEAAFLQLKEKGACIALNTGFPKSIAYAIVNRLQWIERGLIDDYIASDEVEEGRPSSLMIKELMLRAGVEDSNDVIKIGDTTVDIEEGKNAGCSIVVAVTTGATSRSELEEYHPTHIIDDLSELTAILYGINENYR